MKRIKQLINILNSATKAYEEGNPYMSDKEWDEYYFELKELEQQMGIIYPNSPTQSILNYEIVNNLNKVEHNHKMLSLDKTKNWNEFLDYFKDKDVIGMLKLDGLTCSLKYENGELVNAETRGNGIIGEDILHNAKVISSIPNKIPYKDTLIIDGEIICTIKNFKPFSEIYSNVRNFAAGSIRLLDSNECAKRNLTFVVWNVISGFENENSFLNKLQQVEDLGFLITPWTSNFDWDAKDFLIEQAEHFGYPIDGLVGRFDDISYGQSLGETGHHSRAAYAFKFYDEEYETELLNIEWSMGRTGQITPIAVFKPVDDGISIIERASLHNVSVLKETLHYPVIGQKIKVFKANQIIPQISWGEEIDLNTIIPEKSLTIPDKCPVCGKPAKLVESDSGTINLMCANPQCPGKFINRLEHFCGKKGLDIKGLSVATLEKLIDWGWINSLSDIYNLNQYKNEWIQKSGFGTKSVENILAAIENSKTCELHSFITAIGIPLIGSTYAKTIATEEHTWVEFRDEVKSKSNFTLLDGFGPEMTYSILHFNYEEADKVAEYLNIKNSLWGVIPSNTNLTNQTIVITGKLNIYKNRAALQSAIEKAGGKVVGSISKNTNYLINNDIDSNSSKNLTAKKLNISIISEENFIEKFLKNI